MTLRELWALTADENQVSNSVLTNNPVMMRWVMQNAAEKREDVVASLVLGIGLRNATRTSIR